VPTLDPAANGVTDDGRRWWVVWGNCFAGPWLIEARMARSAVASLKREMADTDVRANGWSRRDAVEFVRVQHIHEHGGPLTTSEAFLLDVGWTLAHETTRWDSQRVEAGGPIRNLAEVERYLAPDVTARIIEGVAAQYRA
jgi:hypothetical protein